MEPVVEKRSHRAYPKTVIRVGQIFGDPNGKIYKYANPNLFGKLVCSKRFFILGTHRHRVLFVNAGRKEEENKARAKNPPGGPPLPPPGKCEGRGLRGNFKSSRK